MTTDKPKKRRRFSRIFNFRGLAFKSTLLFLGGISLVLIFSFGYIFIFGTFYMLREAEKNAKNITQLTISRIETIIQPVEEVTHAMARAIEKNEKGVSDIINMSREYVRASPVVFGTCLAFEPNSFQKDKYYYAPYFFEDKHGTHVKMLGSRRYDYFNLKWYSIPRDSGTACWSEPYFDEGGGNVLMCTYSVPLYKMKKDSTRKFIGVLTMDISLESLEKIVSRVKVFESGFAVLVSKDGKMLTRPDSAYYSGNVFDTIKELATSSGPVKININLNDSVDEDTVARIMGEREGLSVSGMKLKDGKRGTIYTSAVGKTGWYLVVVFSAEEFFSDLINFLKKLGGVVLASLIGALLITLFVVRKVARPIRKLSDAARKVGQGDFNAPIPVFKSKNEVGQLARSFSAMQVEIQNYIVNLQETTAAKEKIESELNVAHEIQVGMLPKIFPTQSECDVYAILKPAKAVGGDLYDFFFRDENHLCFVIGDVSGKSVPASLFMAVTRTLFRAKAFNGNNLHEVMESINKELCKDNPNLMFVTFQAAVLDLKTGVVTICNAGHNYPFIHKKDNSIEKYKCKPGLPLGIMEDATYTSESLKLDPGDCILMYTDGVTEAINLKESFFKEDNLITSLLSLPDGTAREIATNLLHDVKEFTQEAEQSDDITLLVVKYRGGKNGKPKEEIREVVLMNNVHELQKLTHTLEELAISWNINPKLVMEFNLALEEWITNIIMYAFDDEKNHPINISFKKKEDELIIIISDDGKEFNPVDHPEPDIEGKTADEREIGGLGIHFIKKIMDEVNYSRVDGKNIIYMKKKINTKK